MTYPVPTKPGFYWAKDKSGGKWQVVEVFTTGDHEDQTLYVYAPYGDGQFFRDFTFGPEVVKPEDLK